MDDAAVATVASGPLRRLRRTVALGPLERRLFWIVVVGLLPLILLSFATLLYNAQAQKRQQIQAAENTMRSVIAAVDAELRTSLAALDALAASPRLRVRDFAGFYVEARALLERRPSWANIVLADPTSQHMINARIPFGSPLPRGVDPGAVEATVRAGVPGVGNLIWSPVLEMYVFAVRLPIREGDSIPYVLTAVLRPEAILEIVRRHVLPDGAVRTALEAGLPLRRTAWPKRSQLPPLLPRVWGLRLFPRSGGADELALDQRLSALSPAARTRDRGARVTAAQSKPSSAGQERSRDRDISETPCAGG